MILHIYKECDVDASNLRYKPAYNLLYNLKTVVTFMWSIFDLNDGQYFVNGTIFFVFDCFVDYRGEELSKIDCKKIGITNV
jgi:hypothetical protein